MHLKMKRWIVLTVSLMICFPLGSAVTFADEYPSRPIQMIVPWSAGGAVDSVARLVGQKLSEAVGKPVVVENKTGASGNIGVQFVAKSQADGYTLLLSSLTTHAINMTLLSKTIGYDLRKDLIPIGVIGNMPMILLLNSSVPATSLQQLITLAKQKPDKLTFATSGMGTPEHCAAELFKMQAGIHMLHVPYKGGPPAMLDLLGGRVDMYFATTATATVNISNPRIKAIATTSAQRIPTFPDLPTMREGGLPEYEAATRHAIWVAPGAPPAIVQRLNAEVQKILQLPEVKSKYAMLGITPMLNTPTEAVRLVNSEIDKWAKVIAAGGIKVE